VQIAPFGQQLDATGDNYPILREQQELAAKTVPNTYMASVMDSGEYANGHFLNKRSTGERLALLALGKLYGREILCDPPEFRALENIPDGVRILFAHVGGGLELRGSEVNGLQLFDESGEITDFTAAVLHDRLEIQSSNTITEVRYAWLGYVEVNLYNSANLSAKPFRVRVE
jgi:sialate O-acetylesterase